MAHQMTTPTDAPAKNITRTVFGHLGERGMNVSADMVDGYEAPAHSPLKTGAGIAPEWFTGDLAYVVRDGIALPFSLKKDLDGYFGESTGSANVATLYSREGRGLKPTLDHFHETGQLQIAKNRLAPYTDHDNLDEVVAFALSLYAKGWLVEQLLQEQCDDFNKGSVGQDQGGIDGYYQGEPTQVKSVTYYASRNTEELAEADVQYLWYQWDCRGGLHYGTDANDVNASAEAVTGVGKTIIKRSTANIVAVKESDRTNVRYLWW